MKSSTAADDYERLHVECSGRCTARNRCVSSLQARRSSRNARSSDAPGVLHECAKDCVHAGLVAVSLLPEKLDDVLIQA
jgi:hypothetical protein